MHGPSRMKAIIVTIKWLSPVLLIALIGGGYFLTRSNSGFNQEISSKEQLIARCDALADAVLLKQVQIRAQSSECADMARSLDELLSARLTNIRSELTSADTDVRKAVEYYIERIARMGSSNPSTDAGLPAGAGDHERAGRSPSPQVLASASAER
jgi:hypothetical protein